MASEGVLAAAAATTGLPAVVLATLAVLVVFGEPCACRRSHETGLRAVGRCPFLLVVGRRRRRSAAAHLPLPLPSSAQCCCACCWAARAAMWCCWWVPATRARPRCSTSCPRAAPTWAPWRPCSPTKPAARWPLKRCGMGKRLRWAMQKSLAPPMHYCCRWLSSAAHRCCLQRPLPLATTTRRRPLPT